MRATTVALITLALVGCSTPPMPTHGAPVAPQSTLSDDTKLLEAVLRFDPGQSVDWVSITKKP